MSTPQDPWQVPAPDGATPASPPSEQPSAPVPGYGPPPAGWGQPQDQAGWGNAPQGPWAGQAQTETKAVVALVLAIVAYTFAPFIAAIAALVLARMAKRDIDASGGRLGGRGLAVAAFWLSVVHLAFVALAVIGLALLVAVGGTTFN